MLPLLLLLLVRAATAEDERASNCSTPARCSLPDEALTLHCLGSLVRFATPDISALLPPLSRAAELCAEYERFGRCVAPADDSCRRSIAPGVQQMYAIICEDKYAGLLREEQSCLRELEEDKQLAECFAFEDGAANNVSSECSMLQAFATCLMQRPADDKCQDALKLSLSLVSDIARRDPNSPCRIELLSRPPAPLPMEICNVNSTQCSCRESGYAYDRESKTCKDVDECADGSAGCSQLCTNIAGSFLCSCDAPYYVLANNNRTCERTDGETLWLFFAHGQSIWNISVDGRSFQLQRAALHKTAMIDVDVQERRLYYADIGANAIERMNIDGTFPQSVDGMEGIAVDWVGRNLYSLRKKDINVQSLDGRFWAVLYPGVVQQPRAIALHPARGLLYVTDWSSSAFIAVAAMDGSFFKKIITERITWPNCIVVDIHADRIFWADAFLDTIEVANLDGSNRRTIISDSSSVPHVFGMALADDYLYWTDWTYRHFRVTFSSSDFRGLLRANKLTGENMTVLAQTALLPYSIKVFHHSLQPPVLNDCSILECSELCLIGPPANASNPLPEPGNLPPWPKVSTKCACSEGLRLLPDGKTCKPDCPPGHFECGGGDKKCISRLFVCDGVRHCSNGADENECAPRICLPGQFQCHDSARCVSASAICDSRPDCPDASDERFCSPNNHPHFIPSLRTRTTTQPRA